MRIFLLLLSLVLLLVTPAFAQEPALPVMAPLNPEFVDYIHDMSSIRPLRVQNVTPEGYGLGYVPSPVDLSPLAGQPVLPSRMESISTPPASYDLRSFGKVTPVRNQSSCGDCWAFATMGSLESNLLTAETWDFSENNLKNTHGFDYAACDGGNGGMSTAYLARWGYPGWSAGPVLETDDPYNPSSDVSPSGLAVQKHVQEVLYLPPRASATDNNNLKRALMNFGGINAAYYDEHNTAAYYNAAKTAYYYNGSNYPNHAITIIGWDDNFSAGNFSTPPPGNGAFLIKNSWGTYWGSGGYFWISYYDTNLGYSTSYVFNGAQAATNFTRVYQYDPLGWTQSLGYYGSTAGWFANVFTAAATEQLTAVSFYTGDLNVSYVIRIYTNVATSPDTGTLAGTTSGTPIAYPGYHTVTLSSPVTVTTSQKFAVVVEVMNISYAFPIPLEYPVGGYSSTATASAGQSYISSDGIGWSDIAAIGYANTNVCLKAFMSSAPPEYQLTTLSNPVAGGITDPDCSAGCWYGSGTTASLLAVPDSGYVMDSWTGDCSGSGLNPFAAVLMNGAKSCTANFIACPNNPAKNTQNPSPYALLQSAYNDTDLTNGTRNGDTIQLLATTLAGADFNRNISVILSGGWDCGFAGQSSYSIIQGPLTIDMNSQTVIVDRIIII